MAMFALLTIFVFHTHDVWLNLHQFLYVLGRHEIQHPDRTRRAQVNAPDDEARGLANLTPDERRVWREAVPAAMRSFAPEHVAMADAAGLWKGQPLAQLKPILDEVWTPYLEGKGTRDEALAAIVARLPN